MLYFLFKIFKRGSFVWENEFNIQYILVKGIECVMVFDVRSSIKLNCYGNSQLFYYVFQGF